MTMGFFVASTDTMASLTATERKSDQRWNKKDTNERDGIRVNNDSGKTVFVRKISVEGVFWSSRGRAREGGIKKRQ